MDDIEITTDPAAPKLLDKKVNELTVRDNLKLAVMLPVITIGGMAAAGAVVSGVTKLAGKFRRNRDEDESETTEPVAPKAK